MKVWEKSIVELPNAIHMASSLNALREKGDQWIQILSFHPLSWAVFGLEGAAAIISYITMGFPDSSTLVLDRQYPRNQGSSVTPQPCSWFKLAQENLASRSQVKNVRPATSQ